MKRITITLGLILFVGSLWAQQVLPKKFYSPIEVTEYISSPTGKFSTLEAPAEDIALRDNLRVYDSILAGRTIETRYNGVDPEDTIHLLEIDSSGFLYYAKADESFLPSGADADSLLLLHREGDGFAYLRFYSDSLPSYDAAVTAALWMGTYWSISLSTEDLGHGEGYSWAIFRGDSAFYYDTTLISYIPILSTGAGLIVKDSAIEFFGEVEGRLLEQIREEVDSGIAGIIIPAGLDSNLVRQWISDSVDQVRSEIPAGLDSILVRQWISDTASQIRGMIPSPQELTLANDSLYISGGNAVSMEQYINTDNQPAEDVYISDAGGYFSSDNVEGALQKLGSDVLSHELGMYIIGTAGESVVAGDVLVIKDSDGKWWKADANDTLLSTTLLIVATSNASADQSVAGRAYGEITTSGLDAGKNYYVSESAGAWTTTAPTTAGAVVRLIGTAISTTKLYVVPSLNYILLK